MAACVLIFHWKSGRGWHLKSLLPGAKSQWSDVDRQEYSDRNWLGRRYQRYSGIYHSQIGAAGCCIPTSRTLTPSSGLTRHVARAGLARPLRRRRCGNCSPVHSLFFAGQVLGLGLDSPCWLVLLSVQPAQQGDEHNQKRDSYGVHLCGRKLHYAFCDQHGDVAQ